MTLADWQRNGWLGAHKTSAREIDDLLKVVERDLADSAAKGAVSETDAVEMRRLAIRLFDDVIAWLRANHPTLLEKRWRTGHETV